MPKPPFLPDIHSPADLRRLDLADLTQVCKEVRDAIVQTIPRVGGHFASNLGSVELAVALHYVFETPNDILLWDVGHQAYPHKILTGRLDRLHTIRQTDGLSGFPHYEESIHDPFLTGHAGTSISSATGMSEAIALSGEKRRVVAIIGDGSMTAGLAFEGLNHAGQSESSPIIVLNDNEMSIDPNVGALSRFMSRALVGKRTQAIRGAVRTFFTAMGPMGEDVLHVLKRVEESALGVVTPGYLFEALGFTYVGPLDGHDVLALVDAFRDIRDAKGPLIIHCLTVKGKGYAPAEKDPLKYHGVGKFDPAVGIVKDPNAKPTPPSYSDVFGQTLIDMAKMDTSVVAVSPAMMSGSGLIPFYKAFPDRCYDVGIAEQHAVTFSAGLCKMNLKPVAAIYSTFLQRGYDQVVHDVVLQKLPVVFCLDRAGLVGADGPTHHGVFDIAYLRHLPGMHLMAPKDEGELRQMLYSALQYRVTVAIRYPRGNGFGVPMDAPYEVLPMGKGELLRPGSDLVIVAYGSRVYPAMSAAKMLAESGIDAAVINARFAKPLDVDLIAEWASATGRVVTAEEGTRLGGFGSAVLEALSDRGLTNVRTAVVGLPDVFIEHGTQEALYHRYGIDDHGIADAARRLMG
ncbi:MAG: 1-deoxy-D-xylulose-5-phosphate synthase [Deltaproteobacteria bacterium]|nr:1-deoxy-D-xylulose-5-phosphate synthase [Deltaproteobacteria bacterium]